MEQDQQFTDAGKGLREIALSCLKLGTIGFGGIAGVVATIENEMVVRRKWIDQQHFLDVVSASYIIPGPNAVEIVMHCGKERGGRAGLIVAGVCYILPAMSICLVLGYLYQRYSALPDVQQFIFGLRPATTALVAATVVRLLRGTISSQRHLLWLCALVFIGSLAGLNEVLLILGTGFTNMLVHRLRTGNQLRSVSGLLIAPVLANANDLLSQSKLFFIFLKIGAVLYGSGYVLFAYMEEALVRRNHWLSRQQLTDAIAVGQMTPGPILSSATFAGYLINGISGGVQATIAIFLPSFFISFFLHKLLSKARASVRLRVFLDGLSVASISIIAVVGIHLGKESIANWKSALLLSICLVIALARPKLNTFYLILFGAVGGYLLQRLV